MLTGHISLIGILVFIILFIVWQSCNLLGFWSGGRTLHIQFSCFLSSTGLFHLFIFFNDFVVITRVVAVPSISFLIPIHINVLDNLISLNIAACPLCTLLSWSLHTIPRLMCHRTAVLASAFTIFGSSRTLIITHILLYDVYCVLWDNNAYRSLTTGIPVILFQSKSSVLSLLWCTLMLQWDFAGVDIPRRLQHELWGMRIDLVSFIVDFSRCCTRFTSCIQILLFAIFFLW